MKMAVAANWATQTCLAVAAQQATQKLKRVGDVGCNVSSQRPPDYAGVAWH